MQGPKRHHWWPQLQSRHWLGPDGRIFVTRRDGSYFSTTTRNIAVENELYTRFSETTTKDRAIEAWFSEEIESPFARVLDELVSLRNLKREAFRGDPTKAAIVKSLGFMVSSHREFIVLQQAHRDVFANYVAALLVRHPKYLQRIQAFHQGGDIGKGGPPVRELTLANMHYVYDIYRKAISDATITFTRRYGDHEYLFSDSGISVNEPWRRGAIPFDIHFPVTPDLAAEIFPLPSDPNPERIYVGDVSNRGVSRQNRSVLADAIRFVFSRGEPPVQFIKKYFGVPAPAAYAYQVVNGRLETKYDPSRDK